MRFGQFNFLKLLRKHEALYYQPLVSSFRVYEMTVMIDQHRCTWERSNLELFHFLPTFKAYYDHSLTMIASHVEMIRVDLKGNEASILVPYVVETLHDTRVVNIQWRFSVDSDQNCQFSGFCIDCHQSVSIRQDLRCGSNRVLLWQRQGLNLPIWEIESENSGLELQINSVFPQKGFRHFMNIFWVVNSYRVVILIASLFNESESAYIANFNLVFWNFYDL